MLRVSDLTSYLTCPRLCYYRLRFGEDTVTEKKAAREIYLAIRKGLGTVWAEMRYSELYGETEVFKEAKRNFKLSKELESLTPVEWEVNLKSDRLGLSGVVDEIVEERGRLSPLIISLKAPEKGVWYADRIKLASLKIIGKDLGFDFNGGFVYHCYDGELRHVEINRKDIYSTFRIVEKVRRLEKGFIPERVQGKYCRMCSFRDKCDAQPSTFAARFLL
jgi:CRISPR-associated exonuclease Cas4